MSDNIVKIVLGPASVELGQKVARLMGAQTVEVATRTFTDGESYVRLNGDVQGSHTVIIQTTAAPQEKNLVVLAVIADAAKRNGANKVTAVVPYLAYARQDKVFLPGETISLEVVLRMLNTAGVDEFLTVNLTGDTSVLAKLSFPARSVSAISLLAEYFVQRGLRKAFALAPDKGAMYLADEAKSVLGGGSDHLSKTRDRHTGRVQTEQKILNVRGETCIIFDDVITSGDTIVNATRILKDNGAARVFAACAHPVLVGDAQKRLLDAEVEEVVGTDSVPGPLSKVSLAPLIVNQLLG